MTLDEAVAIVKPHNDKIVAEARSERIERTNAELLAALHAVTNFAVLYAGGVNSDIGDPETWPPVIQARAAIAKAAGRT